MNSKQPHNEPVLFLDRNLGKYVVPDALRSEGISCEVHDDHLPIDAPDEDWIALAGQKGWIAITKDKNIRHRHAQLASIRKYATRTVVIRVKIATGELIAQVLIKNRNRIFQLYSSDNSPLVVGIDRNGNIKVYLER